MKKHCLFFLLASVALAPVAAERGVEPAQAEAQRVALVIGNSAYQHAGHLYNPGNDAALIANTLQGLGFQLVGGKAWLDLDKAGMDKAIQAFKQSLGPNSVAFFYYAGHGSEIKDNNYLWPVDAKLSDSELDTLVKAQEILDDVNSAHTRLNIIILDACRNNPLSGTGVPPQQDGLKPMNVPENTLIMYAAAPGKKTTDGPQEGNSPFTSELAQALPLPGLKVREVFDLIIDKVKSRNPSPWLGPTNYSGRFCFAHCEQNPNNSLTPTNQTAFSGTNLEHAGSEKNSALLAQAEQLYFSREYEKARLIYKDLADIGDGFSQFKLGIFYENGLSVDVDFREAAYWYDRSAKSGNTFGKYSLGIMLEWGLGVEYIDKHRGEIMREQSKAEGLLNQAQKFADQGDAVMQHIVGRIYEGEHEYHEASLWYEKAANQGLASAQTFLGLLYENGEGVEKNILSANAWYTKASAHGYPLAQTGLALSYYSKHDLTRARELLLQAANQGEPQAEFLLGKISEKVDESFAWYSKSAHHGYARAQRELGNFYEIGKGVSQDLTQAVNWYSKAAKNGDQDAIKQLAKINSYL